MNGWNCGVLDRGLPKEEVFKTQSSAFNILVAIDKNLACFNAANFELGLNQPMILYNK